MAAKKLGKKVDVSLAFAERCGVLIGCVLLWGIFALVMLQMLTRVFLKVGLPWSEELARYLHIVLVFLGLAFAHRLRNHVDMQFFTEGWSPLKKRIARGMIELGIVIVSIAVVVGGIALIGRMGAQRSPSLGLPLTFFVGATIVGFTLLGLEALRQFIQKFSRDDAVAIPEKKEHFEL
jgi:TRAP-type C4-dicarboxylate transport system permease small subunit